MEKISMDKVTINGVEYVKAETVHEGDDYVIVRSRDQGVVCGYLKEIDRATKTVWLTEARQVWCFEGGLTLIDVAKHGLRQGSRLSDTAPGDFELAGYCGIMRVSDPKAFVGWPADPAGRK